MTRGLLIVLEGIDGSGKSTLARGIADAFRARGRTVVVTAEPTDGPHGRRIRELTRSGRRAEMSPDEEFALFTDDRREHVEQRVRPALERGEVVVQDRSYFSTVAYQGDRGVSRERILEVSTAIAPSPDVLLVVDLPVEVALERITKTREGPADDFEKAANLERARRTFLSFDAATVLDGTRAPADLLADALAAIDRVTPNHL
ncbi:MAG: dTMP kinase [Deltaproteobacteria bacterium]|jgi:dTMP kinase